MSQIAIESLKRWRERPDLFVREVFNATPDAWQDEALRAFPTSPRIALKASKGPGKTTCLAWLGWNFMCTRAYANGAAVSISADNLRDNLWKELAVWRNQSKMIQAAFEWQKERIFAKEAPDTWFLSARSWSKTADATQLGNTLAGLHSKNVFVLADESGGMPNEVLESAEGIFSGAEEAHIVQAGNTNSLTGALYNACVKKAHQWKVIVISGDPDDPMRSPRVPIEWARDQIKTYGRDSPFVKVSVLGEWPAASLNALIGPNEVERAMKRAYREYEYGAASKVLGVDVAREGDDASVICPRQGLVVFPHIKMRNVNSIQGAGAVARKWDDWRADACFVDATGGFGAGWIDGLRQLGKAPIGVEYAGQAHNPARYANKRAEMYFDAVQWIKDGGQLPPIPELSAALTQTLYTFRGDRLLLEPKEEVKIKLGYSPDDADAFVQTFAEPVTPKNAPRRRAPNIEEDYDAFAKLFKD